MHRSLFYKKLTAYNIYIREILVEEIMEQSILKHIEAHRLFLVPNCL